MNRLLDPDLLDRLPDLAARARAIAAGVLPGLHAAHKRGPSAEPVDRRPYEPGDDPRRIDWRVWARTRQLLVKRARKDADLEVHLVVDASASMAFRGPRAPRSKIEHGRLLAASLAHVFLRAGDRVGLLAFGKAEPLAVAPAGGGRRRLLNLATALESLEEGGSIDAASALRALRPLAHERGIVVLLSDLLPPPRPSPASRGREKDREDASRGREKDRKDASRRREEPSLGLDLLYKELRAFAARGHDVLVLQIRDPDEADLGFTGPHRFVDPESGAWRDADASAVKRSYRERARAFALRARDLAREARIDHVLAPTDASPVEPLAEIFARRSRTRAR